MVLRYSETNPFAGKTILLFGDLLQLPLLKSLICKVNLFVNLNSLSETIWNIWQNLLMCELTEVIHQQGDNQFI